MLRSYGLIGCPLKYSEIQRLNSSGYRLIGFVSSQPFKSPIRTFQCELGSGKKVWVPIQIQIQVLGVRPGTRRWRS